MSITIIKSNRHPCTNYNKCYNNRYPDLFCGIGYSFPIQFASLRKRNYIFASDRDGRT